MSDRLWEGVREGCGTCEFRSAPDRPGLLGECRRYPPQMLIVTHQNQGGMPYDQIEAHRPWMADREWCGEYKRKQSA